VSDTVHAARPRFAALDFALERSILENPYPKYAELRAANGLIRGGPAQWVVSRHADVTTLVRDARLTGEFPEEYHRISAGSGATSSFSYERDKIFREHPAVHQLMTRTFSSGAARDRHELFAGLADRLLVPASGGAPFDIVRELALPLAIEAAGEVLGIPAEDRAMVGERAIDLEPRAFGASFLPESTAETTDQVFDWLRDYAGRLLTSRARGPAGGLLAGLRAIDRVSADKLLDHALFLLGATYSGFGTGVGLITNGTDALIHHPGEFCRLRENPALLRTAIDEFIRYDAPVQLTLRLTTTRLRIAGQAVGAGRVLVLLLGSANRDALIFREPDRLDISRAPNPHAGFGGGAYRCLGSAFAKEIGTVVFSRLAAMASEIAAAGPAIRQPVLRFRYHRSLPVQLTPAKPRT
jgi:cytochrome P450